MHHFQSRKKSNVILSYSGIGSHCSPISRKEGREVKRDGGGEKGGKENGTI